MIKDRNIANDAAIALSKILGGGILGAGRIMYVAPSTSKSYSYWNGKVPSADLFTDLETAYDQVVSGRNDILVLSPDSHTLTAMLTVSKDRVHFIGSDMRGGS